MNVAALNTMGAPSSNAGMRTPLKRGTLSAPAYANPVLAEAKQPRASVETLYGAPHAGEEKVRASGKPERYSYRYHDRD